MRAGCAGSGVGKKTFRSEARKSLGIVMDIVPEGWILPPYSAIRSVSRTGGPPAAQIEPELPEHRALPSPWDDTSADAHLRVAR